jgi:predicted phage baseplate assembly protein
MTLPRPDLDNRTFAQLVSESIAQINRLAASWTDYNASDPGITLIELIAWLSEQNLYRASRITPEMSRAFLRLVGVSLHPAGIAQTVILLRNAGVAAIGLPERTQVSDPLGAVMFETRDPVTVSPAALVQVLTGGGTLRDVTAENAEIFDPSKDARIGTYPPFGEAPAPGAALYLGFDRPLGLPGENIALHLWSRTPQADALTAAALQREWEAGKAAAERDCPPDQAALLRDWRQHYSAQVIWEFYAGADVWQPLADVVDETRALTLTGFIRFAAPNGHAAGGPGPSWFVRCRLLRGGFDCTPWVDRIAPNAVGAEHAVSIDAPEILGASRGHAGERYTGSLSPIVAGSTRLTLVAGAQQDHGWTEVLEWDLVGPHDRSYRLEPERGRITFGNGMRGAVPPDGWDVTLDYRVGGGVEGNIPPAQLTRLAASDWNAAHIPGLPAIAVQLAVAQPYAAAGGAAAETLAAAEARAIGELTRASKTVTLADFATLALATPGVPIARAQALANRYPALPCFTAAGSITVIVVPDCPGPAPMPGADFLRAIERYLHRRRPVTTEIHVIAPTYVKVAVAAWLQATADSDPTLIKTMAQQKLDAFFSPLSGGPDGTGWPIGRYVYRAEVMALLASIPGVLSVSDLTLSGGDGMPSCSNIAICAGDLIQSMQHGIEVGITGTTIFNRSRERECS